MADKIIWTEPAEFQLAAVIDYIALDNESAAQELFRKIIEGVEAISFFPDASRIIPELQHSNYRQLWIKPCWVYFKITGSVIHILHVRREEKHFRLSDIFGEN